MLTQRRRRTGVRRRTAVKAGGGMRNPSVMMGSRRQPSMVIGGPGARRRTGMVAGGVKRRETNAVRRTTVRKDGRRTTKSVARRGAVRRETGTAGASRRETGMRGLRRRTKAVGNRRLTRRMTSRRMTSRRMTSRRMTSRRMTNMGKRGRFAALNDRLPGRNNTVENLGAQFWGDTLSKKILEDGEEKKEEKKDGKDDDNDNKHDKKNKKKEENEAKEEVKKEKDKDQVKKAKRRLNENSPNVQIERYGGLNSVLTALITMVRREMIRDPVGTGRSFENSVGSPSLSKIPESVWQEDKSYFLKLREIQSRIELSEKSPLRTLAPVDEFRYAFDRRGRQTKNNKDTKFRLPWNSVTSQSSLVRDFLSRNRSKKKRTTVRESWAKNQAQTWKYRRERAEHLLDILEREQASEIKRLVKLNNSTLTNSQRETILVKTAKERADSADKIMRILQDYRCLSAIEMAEYLKYTLAGYKDKQLTEALSTQSNKMKKKIDKLTNAEHCYLRKLKMPPEPKILRDPLYDTKRKKKKKKKKKIKKNEPPGLNDDDEDVTKENDNDDDDDDDDKKNKEVTLRKKRTVEDHRKKVRVEFNGGKKKKNTKFSDEVHLCLEHRGVIEATGHGYTWKLPGIMEHVQSGSVKSGRFYSDLFGKHLEDMTGVRQLNGKTWSHPMDV